MKPSGPKEDNGYDARVVETFVSAGRILSIPVQHKKRLAILRWLVEDFEPGRVAEQVPALKALLETRNKLRDLMSKVDRSEELENLLEQVLKLAPAVEEIAARFHNRTDFLYLGRGINYPIALEGALKLKEISYIHAEGYPAGEMKHGPNALIDENLPVVIIATRDVNNPGSMVRYEKTISNLKEVKARSGVVIALATEGDEEIKEAADHVLYVPAAPEELSPILEIVPLQLLAYHIAVRRGCDVDQPRNLAKSVTVE